MKLLVTISLALALMMPLAASAQLVGDLDISETVQEAVDQQIQEQIAEEAAERRTGKTKEQRELPPPIPVEFQIPIPGFSQNNLIVYGPAGNCPEDHVCVRTIEYYLNAIFKWAAGAGVILAIVLMMIGGVEWMIGSAVGTIDRAKKRLRGASMGLLLLLGTTALLSFINPDITRLGGLELPVIRTLFLDTENTGSEYPGVGKGDPTSTSAVPAGILATAQSRSVSDLEYGDPANLQRISQQSYPNTPYGECGTIKESGCGPTSLAMIMRHYDIKKVVGGGLVDAPYVTQGFASQGDRACAKNDDGSLDCKLCTGTAWEAFEDETSPFLQIHGMESRQINPHAKDSILQLLAEGKPLIASVGCSRFTGGGHFIVLAGMDDAGLITVKDPGSSQRKKTSVEELWSTAPYKFEERDCTSKKQYSGETVLRATWYIHPED